MQKTILITGSTDGIGLVTAQKLFSMGHHVLLHGRNPQKLEDAVKTVSGQEGNGKIESYAADLSNMAEVEALAKAVTEKHNSLDVLINNAGIYKTSNSITDDELDVRFVVNTFAPYLLTQRLLPQLGTSGRVINLSSATQAPVNLQALEGQSKLDDMGAYAQSKLAITMWTRTLSEKLKDGPAIIAVNPGSLLASKMVKEGFGVAGNDLSIGADILIRASFSDEFSQASGKYYDNDLGQFSSPHPDGLDAQKSAQVVDTIEAVLAKIT